MLTVTHANPWDGIGENPVGSQTNLRGWFV